MHPDVNKNDPDCHVSFLKLNEAYSVLSKPYKRQLYDASLMSSKYGTVDNYSSSWVETNAPFGKVKYVLLFCLCSNQRYIRGNLLITLCSLFIKVRETIVSILITVFLFDFTLILESIYS